MRIHIMSSIAVLRRLSSDLDQLEGGLISAQSLIASPVLTNWRYSFRRASCIDGIVEGHPSIPDGRFISTSEVWARFHEDDDHFVRTLNRWYRLGAPSAARPADAPFPSGDPRG